MSWQDRSYNRDSGGGGSGGGVGSRVLAFLSSSFPLGTYLSTRVRVHITFIILVVIELLQSQFPLWALRWTSLLFVSVLLHEFGHVLACRAVGGQADDILMWPLGGLAYTQPPHRPGASFITTAGGPLVTLLLAVAGYAVVRLWSAGAASVGLNPFQHGFHVDTPGWVGVARDLYVVNYSLLLFNLCLVFYPFDGGRLVQAVLWWWYDYERSMRWATAIGMAGAGAVVTVGILEGSFMLATIGLFGFFTCYRQAQLVHSGVYANEAAAYNPGYYDMRDRPRRGVVGRMMDRVTASRTRRGMESRDKDDAEVDRILGKVRDHGMHSLTRGEKKTLQRATERQRRVG